MFNNAELLEATKQIAPGLFQGLKFSIGFIIGRETQQILH